MDHEDSFHFSYSLIGCTSSFKSIHVNTWDIYDAENASSVMIVVPSFVHYSEIYLH